MITIPDTFYVIRNKCFSDDKYDYMNETIVN